MLFNQEATEIWANTHYQNCHSGKDIMLKTAQPFFKSYCDLHAKQKQLGAVKGALPSKVESLIKLVRSRTNIKLWPSRSED